MTTEAPTADAYREALEDDRERLTRIVASSRAPLMVWAEPGYPIAALDDFTFPSPASGLHLRPDASPLTVASARALVAAAAMRRYLSCSINLLAATSEAQVALLKLVEEPGEMKVVLFSTDPGTVIEPLLSRCITAVLPPAGPDLRAAVLVSRGVSADRVASLPEDYPGTISDAVRETSVDRGPVDELLSALATRDPVRAMTASRAFSTQHAEILGLAIERHLAGTSPVPALAAFPPPVLASWASVLALSSRGPSAGLAARWGITEVLGASA